MHGWRGVGLALSTNILFVAESPDLDEVRAEDAECVSGQSQVSLRSVSGHSKVSLRSVPGLS